MTGPVLTRHLLTVPQLLQLQVGVLLCLAVGTAAAADLSTAAPQGTKCQKYRIEDQVAQASGPSMLARRASLATVSAEEPQEDGVFSGLQQQSTIQGLTEASAEAPHEDKMLPGLQQRSTVQGLSEAINQAYSPEQRQDELLRSKVGAFSLAKAADVVNAKSAVVGESSSQSRTSVSKKVALNATKHYIEAVSLAARGLRKPYLYGTFYDSCEDPFEVVDPVGSAPHTSIEGLVDLLDTWPNFTLHTHVVTLAQDYSYTAAFSTMKFDGISINRTDFLKIHSDGSVQSLQTYWSKEEALAPQVGVGLSAREGDPFAEFLQDNSTCVDTMHRYFTALNELGTLQSYAYFDQFNASFEVHDPFGTPPMTSVAQLQKFIPELAKTLAPNGFTVSVEGLAVTADPYKCSAYLKLNIIKGPSIDIIDIFEVTSGDHGSPSAVSSLKAIWNIPSSN